MRIKIKPNAIILLIVISLCTGTGYFYLIDRESVVLGLKAKWLPAGIALLWGALIWIQLRNRRNPRFPYDRVLPVFLLLAITSALQAYSLYGQSFFMGLFNQYFQIAWVLLYYPLSKYIYYRKIGVGELKKLIKIVGTIELVVFISQHFLSDTVQFTYVISGMRYGEIRYYFSCVLLDLLLFFEFAELTNSGRKISKANRIVSLVYIVLILFDIMVVQKYRLSTLGLLLCMGMGVFISKGSISKKTGYFLLALIGGMILYNTTLVQDILNELLHGKTIGGVTSTLKGREIGRAFYFDVLFKHPILGGGYPDAEFDAAVQFSGLNRFIRLSDNGFFGLLFVYGAIGAVWMAVLWIKMLRYGWTIYKKKGVLTYFLFPLFFLITAIQEAHWYWTDGFMALVLFLTIQQNELADCLSHSIG